MLLDGPPSWRQRGQPQPIDEAEDFPEQFFGTATSANWKVTYRPWRMTGEWDLVALAYNCKRLHKLRLEMAS